ncbi:MAG: hypothetical protein Q9163_003606 [Psora crenata]
MYNSFSSSSPSAKVYVSNGTFPRYIDPAQPPAKRQPFGTVLRQPFTHTVVLNLPGELYSLLWHDIVAKLKHIQYDRVIMSLSEVLEGDFFNQYIKSGQLRFELPKEVYERTGLVGHAIRDQGRKHIKTRYAIEIDLRQPSMLHGRKGFDRIAWACRNVLSGPVTWLFHDLLGEPYSSATRPISQHHPVTRTVEPEKRKSDDVLVPSLGPTNASSSNVEFEQWALETYEWLGLVSMQSPRVQAGDKIDPFLSRYQLSTNDLAGQPANLITLTWKGLLPATWIRNLIVELTNAMNRNVGSNEHFFALSAYAFETAMIDQQDGYTILSPPRITVESHITPTGGGITGERLSVSQGRDIAGLVPNEDLSQHGQGYRTLLKDPYSGWAGPYAIRRFSPDSGYETATSPTPIWPDIENISSSKNPFLSHAPVSTRPNRPILKLNPPARKPQRLCLLLTESNISPAQNNPPTQKPQRLVLTRPKKPLLRLRLPAPKPDDHVQKKLASRHPTLGLNPPNSTHRISKPGRRYQTLTLHPPTRRPSLKLNPPRLVQFTLADQEKDNNDTDRPDHERLRRQPTPFPEWNDDTRDYIWICCPDAAEPIPPRQPDLRLVMTSIGRVWVDFNAVEPGSYEDILM